MSRPWRLGSPAAKRPISVPWVGQRQPVGLTAPGVGTGGGGAEASGGGIIGAVVPAGGRVAGGGAATAVDGGVVVTGRVAGGGAGRLATAVDAGRSVSL